MARKRHNIHIRTFWTWAEDARDAKKLTVHSPRSMSIDWSNGCDKPFELHFEAHTFGPATWTDNLTGQEFRSGEFEFNAFHLKDGIGERGKRRGRPRISLKSDGNGPQHLLSMLVGCRKCPRCLVIRRRMWRKRIVQRLDIHPRTWFVTLTLHAHARHLMGHDPKWVSRQVTLYLNAFRQAYFRKHKRRPVFKYVVAFEKHKDGTPHVHLFMHEGFEPLRRREIEAPWKWGFANAKLVSDKREAANYVSKYFLKNFVFQRIRASLKYKIS